VFVNFFYELRDAGIPVNPTSFLRLQKALGMGLVQNLNDFYTTARSLLVKSERYFDLYDRIFAHYFEGIDLPDPEGVDLSETAKLLLQEWLKSPEMVARALGMDAEKLKQYTPEELLKYFLERLKEQTGQHHGGHKWIGTGGTSPVGHSGYHPGGMRVGGRSRNKSAIKVAMERRYRDYSVDGHLSQAQLGEALKRLRRLIPAGPRDQINVDRTIYETMRNAGEIEIVFDRRLKDKLKVILMIDNGGWSMDPYIPVVQHLFNHARYQFKDIKTYFFHNTIYDRVWEDPRRVSNGVKIEDFARVDPESRLIIVGDASMANWELVAAGGSIYIDENNRVPSIERLRFLAQIFPHSVWLNPVFEEEWRYTRSIGIIRQIFSMFELTLEGLEKSVAYLMRK
jgi:uncharacterized protein with von Willebrand factor type A (vWA) domain